MGKPVIATQPNLNTVLAVTCMHENLPEVRGFYVADEVKRQVLAFDLHASSVVSPIASHFRPIVERVHI